MKKMLSCVVLDLDETLCHTFRNIKDYIKLDLATNNKCGDVFHRSYILDFIDHKDKSQDHMAGIKRPYLDTFLDYCFDHWDRVVIYTAGTEEYAHALVKVLFPKRKPHHIYHREHCLQIVADDGTIDHIKPLKKLFDLPEFKNIDIKKTVMIDNKENNFVCNKWMGLTIPDYEPRPHVEDLCTEDTYLLGAIKELEKKRQSFTKKPRKDIPKAKESNYYEFGW